MKKKLLILLAVLVASGIALQILLNRSLPGFIRSQLLPQAEAALAARVELDRISLSLLPAAVQAEGFRVGSPSGAAEPDAFSLGRGRASLRILPLLRGVVRIRDLRADDLVITLSTNTATRSGAARLRERLAGTPADDAGSPDAGTPRKSRPVRLQIDRMDLQTLLRLAGRKEDGTPDLLCLQLRVRGENLATYDTGGPDGQFRVEGHLAQNPDAFVVDLRGTAGPLAGGETPDFTIEGGVGKIDMRRLKSFTKKSGIEGDSASIGVKLACRNGVYQKGSELRFRILGAHLSARREQKKVHLEIPPDFTLAVPVSGPVHAPELDFTTGLVRGLLTGFAADQRQAQGADLSKDLGKALKKLGEALEKKP